MDVLDEVVGQGIRDLIASVETTVIRTEGPGGSESVFTHVTPIQLQCGEADTGDKGHLEV
jgi:hypothetical protein